MLINLLPFPQYPRIMTMLLSNITATTTCSGCPMCVYVEDPQKTDSKPIDIILRVVGRSLGPENFPVQTMFYNLIKIRTPMQKLSFLRICQWIRIVVLLRQHPPINVSCCYTYSLLRPVLWYGSPRKEHLMQTTLLLLVSLRMYYNNNEDSTSP